MRKIGIYGDNQEAKPFVACLSVKLTVLISDRLASIADHRETLQGDRPVR